MASDSILVAYAVATQHVARGPGDFQCLAAVVALEDARQFNCRASFVAHAPQPQAALQAERDLGQHVDEFFLHQLIGGQRPAELLAIEHVVSRTPVAVLCRTHRPPADPEACAVEAGKRAFQTSNVGKGILVRAEDAIHHDFAGNANPESDLAVNRRRRQALTALLQDKSADYAFFVLCPDQEKIGNRAVRDPGFCARQRPASRRLLRTRDHAARIGAGIRFGQAEATDQLACQEPGQIFLLHCLTAELVNRQHYQ